MLRRAPLGDNRPIGVFDSGAGGLTVLRAIREQLPMESTIYVGDLLHFPYGPRYPEEVRSFAFSIIRYLASCDVKLIVIACNTATAAALHQARELFDVPIVGVISPAAQAAVETTRTGRVAVISTEGTRLSQEYLHAVKELDPTVGVYQKACPDLVDIVESGQAESERAYDALRMNLAEIVRMQADVLVLGCTHYTLLKPVIQRLFTDCFQLIDCAEATASKVERVLTQSRMRAGGAEPAHKILVTADAKRFQHLSSILFGANGPVAEESDLFAESDPQQAFAARAFG